MKKKNLVMMLMALSAFAGVNANEGCASCAALSQEEQTFVGKLSDRTQKLFTMMDAEQRKEAMDVATDPALTADAAVDRVLGGDQLATVGN
jgi:hypothetical protein